MYVWCTGKLTRIYHMRALLHTSNTHIYTHTRTHIYTNTHTHTHKYTLTPYTSFAYATNSLPYITPLFRILCLSLTHTHTHTHKLFLSFTCSSHSLCSPHTHHIVTLSSHTPRTFARTPRTSFSYATRSLYNKHVCCRDREGVWFMRQSVCVCGVRGIYIHHTLSLYNKHVCYRDRQCVRFKREYVFVCVVWMN